MPLWVGGEGWGPFRNHHWTFSPYREGSDNSSLPPPRVAATAIRGPVYYCPVDGHTYRTWIVDPPIKGDPKQTIVDWREKLDITKGDPMSKELTQGQ